MPLQTIFKSAVFRLTDRGKNTKRFDVFEKEHVAHLSEGTSTFLPVDPTIHPNHEKTVAFVTCLFLERKHAFQLLSHLDGFQNTTTQEPSLELRASNECYSMYCCRLPQPKLESSDIMLDMLNELGRCPDELYRLLSEEDKKRFHIKLDAKVESDEDLNSNESENGSIEVQQEVVLKRHSDRFPYFALRYFDDTEAFPTLRFDVHLGKQRIKKPYPKIIFKEKRQRILTQDLHDYTRLNKSLLELGENMMYRRMEDGKLVGFVNATFAKTFHPTWLNTDGDGQIRLRDEIEQFSPQYNFGENVIGFKFIDTNLQNHPFLLPNFMDYKNEKPDAIISTYELRNLFLYHYLYTKGHIKIDAEVFIKNFIDKMGKLFNDIKSSALEPLFSPPDYKKNQPLPFVKGNKVETKKRRTAYKKQQQKIEDRRIQLDNLLRETYDIPLAYIPDAIKEYLLAYQPNGYKQKAIEKFEKQRKIVKKLIKDAENGYSLRIGEQATWLAEDIVFLTPATIYKDKNGNPHKQKLNNDQYRILQSAIAYFSTEKEEIIDFLHNETSILSLNPKERHPFLNKINIRKCGGIFDFYKHYLDEKQKWLEKILDKNNLSKMTDESMEEKYGEFLPTSVKSKKAIDRDYFNMPILLPRGLFNQSIAEALSSQPESKVKPDDKAVHCIAQLLNGDLQEFYKLPHFYPPITVGDKKGSPMNEADYSKVLKDRRSELKDKLVGQAGLSEKARQELKNAYSEVNRAKINLLDQEQFLRHIQANDRALWLMVQERQQAALEHEEIRLDELKLHNIESILGKPVQARLRIPNSNLAIKDNLPIRRYGDLRRIAKDRRLENLAKYYETAGFSEIEHEVIKKEFERYDLRRVSFFGKVYQFEMEIYDRFRSEFSTEILDKNGYFAHWDYANVAVNHSPDIPFNKFFQDEVIQLRNKFLHNEFPRFDWLLEDKCKADGEYYADKVFDIAEEYYGRMLSLVQTAN